jgi:crotonobetainyl-CoA:carnitine CoA-transferase CaiB-like acyl-CoA transferase
MPDPVAGLIEQAWTALVDGAAPEQAPGTVEITGSRGHLSSRYPVEDVATACVASALLAANALHRQRGGSLGLAGLDRGHVAAAVRSERYFRRRGRSSGVGFASLSRFWRTADGWIRTHANYPWHRAALLAALGTSGAVDTAAADSAADAEDAVVDALAAAMAERRAEDVEEAVFAAGGVAGVVRSLDAWCVHPQGQALARNPLIGHRLAGDAVARARTTDPELPASGVRVLDLTRVIAGPVCTRYLGALGADVLRLDPPRQLDLRGGEVADTLLGKRSAMLDLSSKVGNAALHHLLDRADIVICGYRPSALDQFGLSEDALAERHPGIIVVAIDAWGHEGPWAARRGFDSIVQAPTGIAMGESVSGDEPGALPCQLLDHGTGYLAAAAALDGLRRQAEQGGTHARRVSLARTAWWLTSSPAASGATKAPANDGDGDAPAWLVELDGAGGPVTAVLPPGRLGRRPLAWPFALTGYGNDRPSWPSL